MTEQITLTLPTGALRNAEILGQRAGRPVSEWLVETILVSLRPWGESPIEGKSPSEWSDEEVIAAIEQQMPRAEDERLSELLEQQQAGRLTERERGELSALMNLYQRRLLSKAQALQEAVHRGLRGPLQP